MIIVLACGGTGALLLATAAPTLTTAESIPTSAQLDTLPPQTIDIPEFTSTISNLPVTLDYTHTRNIQDTIGYIVSPTKKGSYTGIYRGNSNYIAADGRNAFLVDVPSARATVVIYDNEIVDCASLSQQRESSWHCELPQGEDYE
jgi:hypothetical protein